MDVTQPIAPLTEPDADLADARWLRVSEQVLRGLNHALSNRIAGVSAVASVLEPDDEPLVAQLREEIGRMEQLLVLLRLLPRLASAGPEAIRLEDIVPDAVALALHHPEIRDAAIAVPPLQDVPPMRCRPTALLHALVLLLVEGALAPGHRALTCPATDAAVTILVGDVLPDADGPPGRAQHPAAVSAQVILAADGALVWDDGGGSAFAIRLPTLAALRARSRAGA
jgi:hypothetical protein